MDKRDYIIDQAGVVLIVVLLLIVLALGISEIKICKMGVPNNNTIKPKQMGPVATAALGIGTQMVSGLGNQIFGEMNQARELRGQRKALAQQNAAAMDIWEKTNYKA